MKKLLKIIPIFCLMFIIMFGFSACDSGSYTITFQSNNGTEFPSRTYIVRQSITSLPTPSKIGWSFLGWYTDEEYSHAITPPFEMPAKNLTLYAKYEINENDFQESGRNYTWGGGTLSPIVSFNKVGTYYILIKDVTTAFNINKIEISQDVDNACEFSDFNVLDNYGKIIEDINVYINTWEPEFEESVGEHKYLLEIVVFTPGNAKIQIS